MSIKPMERADAAAKGEAPDAAATGGTVPAISDAQLLSVLDTAADGIIIIDEHGVVITYNKACERLFGYSAAEMIGRNVNAIMPPDMAHAHDNYINNYLTHRTGARSSASGAR